MSLNSNQMPKQDVTQSDVALRFQRNGELHWQQLAGDGNVQSEPVAKLLEQGRITQAQVIAVGVVWVPTEQLVLTEVELPAKRRAEIDAALPYALEEQLAKPVESYHFAILNKQALARGSVLQTAVVSKTQMQLWRDTLQQLNLAQLLLVADCFAIPLNEDGAACLQMDDADSVQLCRSGTFSGTALAPNLQLAMGVKTSIELTWSQVLWSKRHYDTSKWRELGFLNLAQGEFSSHKRTGMSTLWLWPNLAAAMLMATLLASSYLQTENLQQDARAYQEQSEKLFRSMFPNVKRVVNLKAQTLNRLQQSDAPQGKQLMPLIYQLEPLLAQSRAVQIDEMRWNQNSANLQLKVSAPQSRQLQQLAQRLEGMNAKLTIKNVTPEVALGVLNVGTN